MNLNEQEGNEELLASAIFCHHMAKKIGTDKANVEVDSQLINDLIGFRNSNL